VRLTLFPKLLAAFLALSLPALLWLSLDAARRIGEVGQEAVQRSTRALDAKARETLEMQAVSLAAQVTRFFEERVQDLQVLAKMPKEPEVFLAFSRGRTGELWRRRQRPEGGIEEVRERVPLYREISWVGLDGREVFRVEGDRRVAAAELRDVSDPRGTSFGTEEYFREALTLTGEPYVGHVVGRHLGRAEQLAGATTPEAAVGGAEYRGLVRFALAGPDGVVVLALDHRHLMEFTQHVLPLSRESVVFPSYLSGNYAFLFDDEGWIITHPKFWDIRGLDDQGRWLPAYSPDSSPEDVAAGRIPFNLDQAGFVHPDYPTVAAAVRAGRSGVTRTFNVAGVDKVMAYAPIFFRHGSYAALGVLGGVTIGARTEAFHRDASAAAEGIREASRSTLRTGFVLAWCLGLAVLVASLFLSRAVSHPVRTMAFLARRVAGGDLEARMEVRGHDELAELAQDLNRMARLLGDKEGRLRQSLRELQASRDDAQAYALRLEEQLRILNHLQSISEFLGTSFQREAVLDIILDTCVRGVGFDRVVLHVLDPADGDQLRCLGVAGFDPVEEVRLRQRPLSLERHDCVPVRVVRTGRPVYVPDVDADENITALDRRIAQATGTTSFVYAPMKIRDKVVGVMGADNALSGRPIPEHLVGALQIVAGQAARAIERARLYDEALRARGFVEAVIDSLGSGLLTMDGRGRVLTLNPYARETLALDHGPEGGATALADLALDPSLVAWVSELLGGAHLEPREFAVRVGGEMREFVWVPSRFERLEDQGLVLQFRDVTEEKEVARSLERMDRLASLGRMAAGVAHEVRNPLTGVALLLDDLHDRLATEADRVLVARAMGEIERLEGIVQELLDYARVDVSHRRLCPLGEVVQGSLFLVHKAARNQGVAVDLDLAEATGPVMVDPDKLKQALLNVYLNALQAMPGGGRLTVAVSRRNGGLQVAVADTGCGIEQGELERVFEPFFTRRPGGSGLGLSIAHTIVQNHGGQIELASRVGEGTRVTILLPLGGMEPG
jgi:signal transduction histidine kinase/HAMP domain-containing protein